MSASKSYFPGLTQHSLFKVKRHENNVLIGWTPTRVWFPKFPKSIMQIHDNACAITQNLISSGFSIFGLLWIWTLHLINKGLLSLNELLLGVSTIVEEHDMLPKAITIDVLSFQNFFFLRFVAHSGVCIFLRIFWGFGHDLLITMSWLLARKQMRPDHRQQILLQRHRKEDFVLVVQKTPSSQSCCCVSEFLVSSLNPTVDLTLTSHMFLFDHYNLLLLHKYEFALYITWLHVEGVSEGKRICDIKEVQNKIYFNSYCPSLCYTFSLV